MTIQDWFPLGLTGFISLQSKGLSRVSSSATVQKHQFLSAQPSLWSNIHICTWLLKKPQLCLYGPLSARWCLCFLICCLSLSELSFQGASIDCMKREWLQSYLFQLLLPCNKPQHSVVWNNLSIVFTSSEGQEFGQEKQGWPVFAPWCLDAQLRRLEAIEKVT